MDKLKEYLELVLERMREALGISYVLILLFMIMPFFVVSCGEGSTKRVLAKQSGYEVMFFQSGNNGQSSQGTPFSFYLLVIGAWALFAGAGYGLFRAVKNTLDPKLGFKIGVGGVAVSLFAIVLIMIIDGQVGSDMEGASMGMMGGGMSLNVEVGIGLVLMFLTYAVSAAIAKYAKPKVDELGAEIDAAAGGFV